MKETYLKVLPNSKMGDAIEYTYSLLPRLSRYVNDGRINIDNNLIENAIRPLAIGRKNYLFCGNDVSAYRAAIVYSLISTCKAVDVDPRTWMEDVLRKIPYCQHRRSHWSMTNGGWQTTVGLPSFGVSVGHFLPTVFFERNDSRSLRSEALICASTFLLIWNSVSIIYCSGQFEDLSQYTKHYVVHKRTNTLRYNNISYNTNIIVLPT